MTQYLVLIHADENELAAYYESVGNKELYGRHVAFAEANGPSILGGNALEPTSTATSIRTSPAGEVVVTDGPFAETKEALGGYYLIEAADLDEAIAIAKQVPAPFGGVEVRPVRIYS